MRLSCRAWAAAILAAGWAIAAENTVKEVKVRTLDQFGTDASDVLSYCGVKAGAELSQEALSKDVRELLDTGRYGYAGVELEKVEGGYNVIYVVKRRYRFQEPLAIKGADYLSESKIRKLAELKSGDYIDEPILTTKAGKIRDEYVKKFFPNVKIGTELHPIEGSAGFANVTFTIEEGERVKIRKYRFTNNPSIPEAELRSSFGQRPWYDPRGWFSDTPVSQQDLEDARQLAEDIYKNRGFLDAKVAFPVAERVGKEKVDMVFDVTEGDIYSVESMNVRGVKLFPEHEVSAAAGRLRVDMVAGQETIDNAAKDIRDYYGSRGYVDTAVRVIKEPVPGKPGRMAVTFDVREGELVYIRNIVIRGNNKTKDKVIRREILVSPGEIMNEVRITTSENRLKQLGCFSNVRHVTEKAEGDKRDLVYEVEEQSTGNFMIGAGISSEESVVGFVEITQSNFDIMNWPYFTGGGQKARLGIEAGTRRQTAEISWTEPWFLDRPMALTVELYRRMRWYDEYDEIRTGGAVGLSYPVKVGRVGARYTLELVQMDDVDDGYWYVNDNDVNASTDDLGLDENRVMPTQYFKDQEDAYGDALNSVIRLYWAHDTRDKPFVPTRGYQATVFGEASEGGIGDNEYYKLGVNYRRWFRMPWYHHVLSLRGRFETVDAYSGDLPIYEKLFLGGPRTIRGVEYRDLGPKVYSASGDHAPIGGQTMALVSAEYTVPVFKAVRLAGFVDIGSLGEDAFDPELSNVCVSAGVGVRIDIPGFPIRFDFAKPMVEDDSYTDEEIFSFAIGFE